VTRTAGDGVGLAVDVLTRLGKSFQLAALTESETEELVRSVFGDVQNVVVVAQRLHDVARGNPRDTMQLLRHLVESGLAHYEGAAWLLPQELAESDLPSSMLSAFDARLASVSAEARALAEALALTDPAWISLQDYSDLMDGLDTGRLFAALGALVQAGVLLPEGDRYRFSVRSAASHLEARMAPERKRALHARLAGLAERRGAPIRRVHHLLESGQETLAIDDLVNKIGTDALDYSNHTVELLERAIAAGERLDVPEVSRLAMQLRLAGVSAITANLPVFLRHAPDALRRLRRDTGLDDWQELGDGMPAGERLKTAFQRARERYLATPERERGFAPDESIRRLSRLIGGYTAMAAAAIDCELLLDLPSLRPFFPIAPATAIVQSLVDAQIMLEGGKVGEARAAYSSVMSRAADPSVEMEPIFREQIKYSVAHGIAGIDARAARESALTIADELDKVPQHRANAWHIRRSYYRMLGQIEKVRESQRRIELLQLRDGPQPRVLNFRTDLPACWLSDDLTGLKSSLAAVEAEAVRFPRVRVLKELAYCHYHRLRGEYEAALERLTAAMDIARPGRHRDWHHIAAAHVELLTLLGREDEATGQACDYEVLFTNMGIDQGLLGLGLSHARALLAAGRLEEARERCDKVLELHEDYGAGGVLLARCHETRARVALALDDKTGFDYWAARFAEFSLVAENPAIRAQYERLMQKGSAGEGPLEVAPEGDLLSTALEQVRSGTVNDRLANCIDQTERLRAALSMALDACGAKRGHLFGVRDGALVPLSSAPDSDPPPDLRQALVALFEEERRGEELTAVVEEGATSVHAAAYTRVLDLGFAARMLLAHRAGDPAIVGVIAIEQKPGQARVVPPRVAEAIAEALTARGDVDPITCFIG
jgi:hypothetical protein